MDHLSGDYRWSNHVHRYFSTWPSMEKKISKTAYANKKPMDLGMYSTLLPWTTDGNQKHLLGLRENILLAKNLNYWLFNQETTKRTSQLILQSWKRLETINRKYFRSKNSAWMSTGTEIITSNSYRWFFEETKNFLSAVFAIRLKNSRNLHSYPGAGA